MALHNFDAAGTHDFDNEEVGLTKCRLGVAAAKAGIFSR